MKIDKSQIISMLRSKGEEDKASQADSELPDQVDTEQDKGLLDKLGIDVDSIKGMLPGGGTSGLGL